MALVYSNQAGAKTGSDDSSPQIGGFSITLDGSYTAGGIPISPRAGGFNSKILFGMGTVRVEAGVGNVDLNCADPTNPILKLQAAGDVAELANGAGSGSVIDILAVGY